MLFTYPLEDFEPIFNGKMSFFVQENLVCLYVNKTDYFSFYLIEWDFICEFVLQSESLNDFAKQMNNRFGFKASILENQSLILYEAKLSSACLYLSEQEFNLFRKLLQEFFWTSPCNKSSKKMQFLFKKYFA